MAPPKIGEVFLGRYEIERLLGQGGFAQVFLARQLDLDRHVALKILRPGHLPEETSAEETGRYEGFVKRFEREARLISKLRDPHTVMMHDYGRTEDGLLYMVLEYIDGATTSQLVREEGPFEPARVAYILEQVLRSLREAHSMGILHRDIKPQNIMLFEHMGEHDQVKVLDFGIAKPLSTTGSKHASPVDTELTGSDGMLVGTPRYMSPEQIRADELTPASDLYSLGLIVYELLLGKKAVEEATTVRIISRHLSAQPIVLPAELSLPPRLRSIVDKMLQKEVQHRYKSAQEVLDDLVHWREPPQVTRRLEPLHQPPVAVGQGKKRRATMLAVVTCFALIGAAAAFAVAGNAPAIRALETTPAQPLPDPPMRVAERDLLPAEPQEQAEPAPVADALDVPDLGEEASPAVPAEAPEVDEPELEADAGAAEPAPAVEEAPRKTSRSRARKPKPPKQERKPTFLPVE